MVWCFYLKLVSDINVYKLNLNSYLKRQISFILTHHLKRDDIVTRESHTCKVRQWLITTKTPQTGKRFFFIIVRCDYDL